METRQARLFAELIGHQMRCKHALNGLAPTCKMCGNCYDCGTCEYDQMLQDTSPVVETSQKVFHRLALAA